MKLKYTLFLLALPLIWIAFSKQGFATPESSEAQDSPSWPEYKGIEQLLILSNNWAIAVVDNMQEVLDAINVLSKGEFDHAVDAWEASKKRGKLDWTMWHKYRQIYDRFITEARELAGERLLDKRDYFAISSDSDPDYASGKEPVRVTRTLVSLNNAEIPGEKDIHWVNYCYLQFPTPLKSGHNYAISLDNGKKALFHFDEEKVISRAIKVNQMGYLPDAGKKFAYLGCYLQEFGPMDCSSYKKFQIFSVKSGKKVFEGDLKLCGKNPRILPKPGSNEDPSNKPFNTGEDTYEMDFSHLKEEGEFYIVVPGVGRSWPFLHAKDAYGTAFYTAVRGLYHQRCGIKIGLPYTAWPRIECHTSPCFESQEIAFLPNIPAPKNWSSFDVIGATTNKAIQTNGPFGGWHDAADWDKTLYHYQCVFDLLNAYEMGKAKFADNQLNVPEVGDKIPDILGEAEYGLLVWKKSLNSAFGASGSWETSTHPSIDDPKFPYAYSQRTRWATFLFAHAAAQYARLIAPFQPTLSKSWQNFAEKAYLFAEDPAHSLGKETIQAKTNRGTGTPYIFEFEEKDEYSYPYKIGASLQLYLLTQNTSYVKDLPGLLDRSPKPMVWPFTIKDLSCWLYFPIFGPEFAKVFSAKQISDLKKHYLKLADDFLSYQAGQPYRQSFPNYQDYWMSWGATCMTNQARVLLLAHHLTGDSKYRDGAILNVDFMFGANPMGMSWTTGMGKVYPINIQHTVSEDDGIPDPVPGITIYGITEGIFSALKTQVWESKLPDGNTVSFINPANKNIPTFRRWSCHPSLNTAQCEFTIHETLSSTVFCTAMLLSEGWMPSEALKRKEPTSSESLFGYWYLP